MTKKIYQEYKVLRLDGTCTYIETNQFVIENGVIFFYIDGTMTRGFVLHNIIEFELIEN